MNRTEKRLIELLGEEKALQVSEALGNQKIPGKKFRYRFMKIKFRREFNGVSVSECARKYGVSRATIYKWLV